MPLFCVSWPSGNWTAWAIPVQITGQETEMHGENHLSFTVA